MPDDIYKGKVDSKHYSSLDAMLADQFKRRRDAFDQMQKLRRADEAKHRRQEAEARREAGKPLASLRRMREYEVGPKEALEYRKEDPTIKRFGDHHLREAALIKERYPTLSKWLGLARRAAAAEKIPGGEKLHRKLELLPDRLKNAAKFAAKDIKEEMSSALPFNISPFSVKRGLDWMTDPESSAAFKREGWKMLAGELIDASKHLPHRLDMLKRSAKLGYGGIIDSDIYGKELDIFGREGGRRKGLAAEALRDLREKQGQDQRSQYFDDETLLRLMQSQERQERRELKPKPLKRGPKEA